MAVLINKKRCDNAKECSCIDECPTKAFTWDDKKRTVSVDNSLCINCRQCVIACEAGAVKVSRNEEEYQKIKTEYDMDIMTIEKLFQDRFGAAIVDEKYSLQFEDLKELLKKSEKDLLIELYNQDESKCLINSIPISEIIEKINKPCSYRKINIEKIEDLKEYDVYELPALLLINKNGLIIFKQEGFIDEGNKTELLNKVCIIQGK